MQDENRLLSRRKVEVCHNSIFRFCSDGTQRCETCGEDRRFHPFSANRWCYIPEGSDVTPEIDHQPLYKRPDFWAVVIGIPVFLWIIWKYPM